MPDTGSSKGLRTETDLGVFLVAVLTNAIGISLLNRAYVTQYKQINEYIQMYSKCKLPSMSHDKASNLTRKIHLTFCAKNLILFLLTFAIAYFANERGLENYKIYFGIDSSTGKDYLYYINLILFWISNIYVFAAPVHLGTDMMSTCFLRSLAYLYNVWQVEMKSRRTKEPEDVQGLEDILNLGFYLSNLTRSLNSLLSPFLFIDMIVLSTSSVMWCYTGFAFFGNLDLLEQTIIIPLVYCLTSFGFVCMYVQRLWNKCNDSQVLSDAIEASTKELSIDLLANYHKLDKRLKWKSDVLEERLAKEDPIRPYDFFTMDRSAFLPTLASALTYFIIIIQFKLSESNLETTSTDITLNDNFTINGTLPNTM